MFDRQPKPAVAPSTAAPTSEASGRRDGLTTQLRAATYAEGKELLSPDRSEPVQLHRTSSGPPVQREALEDQLPEGLDLQEASVSFTLPANKTLSSTWGYDSRTSMATTVSIRITPTSLRITTHPSLYFDVQWPGQNMRMTGAGVTFADAASFAYFQLSGGLGSGMIDYTDRGRSAVRELIDGAIAGSPMARPGYNPMTDSDLMATLMRIKANFDALPSAGGGGDVGVEDVSRPQINATLGMQTPFEFISPDGTGLRIAGGGSFSVGIVGNGNLTDILAASDDGPQAAAIAAGIQSIGISSDSIELISDGEPVARLHSIGIAPGGVVTLRRFTLLGSGRGAEGAESLVRLLAGVISLGSRGVPPEMGAELTVRSGGANPTIVHGVSQQMIEDGLSAAVQQLFRDNRAAVPGLDLALIFGVE